MRCQVGLGVLGTQQKITKHCPWGGDLTDSVTFIFVFMLYSWQVSLVLHLE